jgi:hypothetical protein
MSSDPREMYDFMWLNNMTGSVALRPHGTAEAGKVYSAPDGHRFFYATYHPDAVFCLIKASPGHEAKTGKFFMQNQTWFAEDIGRHGATGDLKLSASKAVIEGFMDIFMGVAAATGGPLAAGIAGMNLLVSAGKVKQDWDVYKDAIEVLLYNRKFIEQNAKKLYAVVMIELLYGHLEKTLTSKTTDALLNAIPGPKVAGKVAGVFLGKFGEDDFKERLKALSKLFNNVLVKVADHAASKWPAKLEQQQVHDLAYHHIFLPLNEKHWLKYLDQDTAEKIIRETVDNCLGLQGPCKKIGAALKKFE